MGPDTLINTSSSPPIHYDYLSSKATGTTPCQSKESTTAATTAMLYTKLRKQFTQIRSRTHHGGRCQYEKLSSDPSTTTKRVSTTKSRLNSLLSLLHITILILSTFLTTVSTNPVFVDNPSLAQFQSGRNIRHLPCIVRKSGRSGVCMFAIDCIKQNGTHLGTCIDRFYFGSCCDIKDEEALYAPEIGDNSIDQNTISHHFTSESTTMPTSALFKLTTIGPHKHNVTTIQQQQDVTQMPNGDITQIFTLPTTGHKQGPSTTAVTSKTDLPKVKTTSRPQQSTTHKQSHFVIRTTAKPTKGSEGSKPTFNSTTKKKITTTTTTTTTATPVLTTTPAKVNQDEFLLEFTTPPTKLFTFQTVETTVASPTEPTKIVDFVTTDRIPAKTTKSPHPIVTGTPAANISNTTTHRPTMKPKPQTSRKPPTTKKPTSQNKRTTVKPTRKPLPSTTIEHVRPQNQNTSSPTTTSSSSTSTSTSSTGLPNTTATSHKHTSSPRPKPKPTATITKVPKPTMSSIRPTEKSTTTSPDQTSTTESIKNVPILTTMTKTTKKPQPAPSTSTTFTSSTTASTSQVTEGPLIASTTLKPGLVTWTNIGSEPVSSNKPSDWIPVTTSGPDAHNKTSEPSSDSNTLEEIGVSVSTSVSAVVNNTTIFVSSPHKPIIFHTSSTVAPPTKASEKDPPPTTTTWTTARPPTRTTTATTTTTLKPTKSTTTTTSTEQPSTTSTTSSTTPGSPATSTITEIPLDASSIAPQPTATDSTVEAFTTDNPNMNVTTVTAPTNNLEGVDYRQVCGRRMFPEPRIVGGSNAAFGRWPWQISLRQWRTSTYLHKCGAALLNENWAITAAHCVDNVPPSDLLLRLGEYDLAEEEEPYGYQERRVQIVASHPQFDPRTFEYDLALLRFYEPVTFQPNIIPVCVPDSDENFIGQTAFVTGWGRLYEDGPLPSVLQEVAVPVINNTICESMYRSAGYIEHIPHIFICAGWKKGGYDSCEGDSGGPMVLQRESDKRFQLGGVISWGIGCAEANQPGVYTRISEFRDWINQILQF